MAETSLIGPLCPNGFYWGVTWQGGNGWQIKSDDYELLKDNCPFCNAGPGSPCVFAGYLATDKNRGEVIGGTHPSRFTKVKINKIPRFELTDRFGYVVNTWYGKFTDAKKLIPINGSLTGYNNRGQIWVVSDGNLTEYYTPSFVSGTKPGITRKAKDAMV